MPREVSPELLETLRREFAITYEDKDEDARLTAYAQRGMDYLDRYAQTELNYEEGTQARALLVSYVLYARSQALDEYPANYRRDLLALRFEAARTSLEGGGQDADTA